MHSESIVANSELRTGIPLQPTFSQKQLSQGYNQGHREWTEEKIGRGQKEVGQRVAQHFIGLLDNSQKIHK